MGFIKYYTRPFINKRNFYLIKTYCFYRRDFWGFLRWRRLYKYKRVIYNMLRYKRSCYGLVLRVLYNGIKFFNKNYGYKAQLLFVKKRIKLFYIFLKDKYIGKLGRMVRRKNGELINYFFSLLERRIDVLLVKALYTKTIRESRELIFKKLIKVNNVLVLKPYFIVLVSDFVKIMFYPKNYFFFQYYNPSISKDLEILESYKYYVYDLYQRIFYKIRENKNFYFNFFRKILLVDLTSQYDYNWHYILTKVLKIKDVKQLKKLAIKRENKMKNLNRKSIRQSYLYKKYKPVSFELIRLICLRLYKMLLLFIENRIFFKLIILYYLGYISDKLFIYNVKKYLFWYYEFGYKEKDLIDFLNLRHYYLFFKSNLKNQEYINEEDVDFNYVKIINNYFFYKIRVKRDFLKNLNLLRVILRVFRFVGGRLRKFYKYNKGKEYIKLYGLVNLRLRVLCFYKLIFPRFYKYNKMKDILVNRIRLKKIKNYRVWFFSYNVYLYLKKLKDIIFIYRGYPSYLEVNYKIHIFIILQIPSVLTVYYPFNVDKYIFFDYFRRRGYF